MKRAATFTHLVNVFLPHHDRIKHGAVLKREQRHDLKHPLPPPGAGRFVQTRIQTKKYCVCLLGEGGGGRDGEKRVAVTLTKYFTGEKEDGTFYAACSELGF